MKNVSAKDRMISFLCAGGLMMPIARAMREHWTWNGDRVFIALLFILIGILSFWWQRDEGKPKYIRQSPTNPNRKSGDV